MSMVNHSVMLCSLSAVHVSAVLCERMEDNNSRGHWKVCIGWTFTRAGRHALVVHTHSA